MRAAVLGTQLKQGGARRKHALREVHDGERILPELPQAIDIDDRV